MSNPRDMGQLQNLLMNIDRKGFGAYERIEGEWKNDEVTLHIDRVQRDPFATPSKVRIQIHQRVHGIPTQLWETAAPRKVALEDVLLRIFASAVRSLPDIRGSGRSGDIRVDAGDAEIIARSGCEVTENRLELRFRVGLPAAGRSILGKEAAELLCRLIPEAARSLHWDRLDQDNVRSWADLAEDHALLQGELQSRGLLAFVRDGSILPRASGISQRPLANAVPFVSPESLRVTLPTLHHGDVQGLGIPEGVVLITGGGFHGKTTLLEALQRGVYPHIPGDGREWVVSKFGAVKVRSEDGRAVTGVDIRPFIDDLPGGTSTAFFTTQDASGSTSLAAAILEAAEVGAEVLLLDEDTCSTNLLVRDARMQLLVKRETITPLVDRVRELRSVLGISTVLVIGGSGDYLDEADTVILMENFLPRDETIEARQVAERYPAGRVRTIPEHPLQVTPRIPKPESFDPQRGRRERIKTRGLRELVFGNEVIDLSALEQLVDDSQARAIGVMLKRMETLAREDLPLSQLLHAFFIEVKRSGLYWLDPSPELALPRPYEVAAAVNRLRGLAVEQLPERDEQAAQRGSGRADSADRQGAPSGREMPAYSPYQEPGGYEIHAES